MLQLYVRLMAWLRKDATMIGSYWAAAVLQHAMQHYEVCPTAHARCFCRVRSHMQSQHKLCCFISLSPMQLQWLDAVICSDTMLHAMQVSLLPSSLASHVKADVLRSCAQDIEQLLAAAANQWGCSLRVGVQCIEAMQGDTHPELLHKVMASEGFPKTAEITLPQDAASSRQQTQSALLQHVAPAVPAIYLEASAAIAEQPLAARMHDAQMTRAPRDAEGVSQAEPALAADLAQSHSESLLNHASSSAGLQKPAPQAAPLNQLVNSISGGMHKSQRATATLMAEAAGLDPNTAPGTQVLHPQPAAPPPALPIAWPAVPEQASAPSQRLLDSGRVAHSAWTAPVVPESYEACKKGLGTAEPVSTCLGAPNPPAVTTAPHSQDATVRQMPQAPHVLPEGTLPCWSTTVAQALAASAAGAPRPVADSVGAVASEAPQQGLQKVQSGMLTSKPQSAGQPLGPKLQPVLHRLSHSSFQADPALANLPDSIRPHAHMQSSESPRSMSQLHTSRPQPAKAMPQLHASGAQASMPALQALGPLQVTSHANIASSACPLPQPMHAAPTQPHSSLHRKLIPAQPMSAAACSPQLRWANRERVSLQGLHSSECNDLEPGEPSLPKQTQQQSLPVLQGPATQQLHKLLLQLEATAQSSAMLTGGVVEASHRGQQPLRSEQDGLPASWVRTEHDPEPTPCGHGQLMPQRQAASSGFGTGAMSLDQGAVASEPQEGLSPWCLLPGPLHAAIATAMAHEGAQPDSGASPSTATWPHAGEPAKARGKGVKRPRAESRPRAASAVRPHQDASPVAVVSTSTIDRSASALAAAAQPGHIVTGNAAAAGRSALLPKPGLGPEARGKAQHDASANSPHDGRASSEQHVDSVVLVDSTDTAGSAVSPGSASKADSAPHANSAAAASGSAVPAGSAEQADLVFQPSSLPEPTQEEMPVSQQALRTVQPQSLTYKLEQDMSKSGSASPSQTSDALHPAGPEAKRQHVGATVCARNPDSQQDHGSTGCSISGGHVDAVASRSLLSSQLQLINEHEAQDALLLLHDHSSQAPSGQQQSTGHPERASASVGDAVIDPIEHDTNDGCVSRPPPFVDVDGNSDAYEVDRIVTHQSWQAGSYVRTKYLVRWKGYGPKYDTWQTKTSLRHAQEAIRDYHNSM